MPIPAFADANPRLRLAVEKARQANMPKDNILRAIKKGTGGDASDTYEEIVYEGYGPGGTAVYVEVLTDNKNRAVGELRHLLTKYGGNLGSSGCVGYLFEKKGLITFESANLDVDSLLESALDAGAEDVIESSDSIDVVTTPANFEVVKVALEEAGFGAIHGSITMEPTTTVKIEGKEAERMLRLSDSLEDLDDVQNVYANFDISDEEMARIAG
jgi:YebC/PmpR family DNA-binding regulatory protein